VIPLNVPLPPQLESAIGWSGSARWISICWTACGDCPWIDDGRSSCTGNSWGFLAWRRHPSVSPALQDADLGSSEEDGSERLLLDRVGRQVFLAPATEARWFVRDQWPSEPAVELSPEEWGQLVERIRAEMLARPMPTPAELMRRLREHSRLVAEMVKWLDQHQQPE
jgi:hypothetical protein